MNHKYLGEVFSQILSGCDEALKDAFVRRMDVSLKVAEVNLENRDFARNAEAEQRILKNACSGLSTELSIKALALWTNLLRMSRGRQYRYYVENDTQLVLNHEADIVPAEKLSHFGKAVCSVESAEAASSALGIEVSPVSSIHAALESVMTGDADCAAIAVDSFYSAEWLYDLMFQDKLYINAFTAPADAQQIVLVSDKLLDLPENSVVSVAFGIPPAHGSLAQALSIFSDSSLNIAYMRYKKIGTDKDIADALVFVDFYGKLSDPAVRSVLYQLQSELPFFRVVGYRKSIEDAR